MGVAPRQTPFVYSFHIAQGDVHAANKRLNAVYYAHLAVVAVVHLTRERRKLNGHKGIDIYPGTAHTLEQLAGHSPAAHIVVDKSHLYALSRLTDECVGNQPSECVVGEDVCLKMYMLACRSYRLQQCGEELVAIGVELHLVVLERKSETLVGKELYERTVVIGQRQLALLHKLQHRTLRQLVERPL